MNTIYNYFYNDPYTIDDLNTGDIILFNGCNNIFSYVVECLTWSKYSHCGLVLKNPRNIGLDYEDGIYMIESGNDAAKDLITGKRHFGVEIVNLRECLNKYPGYVYCIKLDFVRSVSFYKELETAYSIVKSAKYDTNPYHLFKTIFNIDIGNNNREDAFICSALLSYLLYSCNIIYYVKWDLVEPRDYAHLTNSNNILNINMRHNNYFTDKFIKELSKFNLIKNNVNTKDNQYSEHKIIMKGNIYINTMRKLIC